MIGGNYIRPQTHNTGRLGRGQLDPIDPQDRRDNSFERAYIKEIRSGFENPLTLQGDTGIEFNPTNSTRRGILLTKLCQFSSMAKMKILGSFKAAFALRG